MEVDLGEFKYIFLLESFYGRCTVSLTTLEQSKWKVAYTAVLILVCALHLTMYTITQTVTDDPEPLLLQISKLSWLLPFHALVMAIIDYKSKISTALNLQAIETQLNSLGVSVPGKRMVSIMRWVIILMNIVNKIWWLSVVVVNPNHLIAFVASFQGVCANLMQGYTFITFLTKVVVLQNAIEEGFSKVKLNQQASVGSSDGQLRNRRKRNVKIQTEAKEMIGKLKHLQASLHDVGRVLRTSFWIQIVFWRLIVEITSLLVVLLFAKSEVKYGVAFYIRITITFLITVVAVVKMEEARTGPTKIKEYDITGDKGYDRKLRKHQTLARIHRGRTPFSCVFFDVNYDLLATVLENSAFIITSIIAP